MDLNSILIKNLVKGKTGQLVIKFFGEDYLCKISIEDGNAIYISIGRKTPDETLDYIANREVENYNFLEGSTFTKRLNEPLNEKLFAIINPDAGPVQNDVHVEEEVPSDKVEAVINDFIDIIGPLGAVISDNVLSEIEYKKGSVMSSEDFSLLISDFINAVPDDKKDGFKNRVFNEIL